MIKYFTRTWVYTCIAVAVSMATDKIFGQDTASPAVDASKKVYNATSNYLSFVAVVVKPGFSKASEFTSFLKNQVEECFSYQEGSSSEAPSNLGDTVAFVANSCFSKALKFGNFLGDQVREFFSYQWGSSSTNASTETSLNLNDLNACKSRCEDNFTDEYLVECLGYCNQEG